MSSPSHLADDSGRHGDRYRGVIRVLALSLLLAQTACSKLMFQPLPQHLFSPDIVNVAYQDIVLASDPGIELHGWKLEASAPWRGSVLFLHGNAENISTHFGNVYWLTEYGYDVYLFDYRGYGKSTGEVDLDGAIRDVDAMLRYTLDAVGAGRKLIVMGHSLGGAFAIHAVAAMPQRSRIASVITVEAFSDYREIAQDLLAKSWLTWALQWPLSFTIDNSYSPVKSVAELSPVPLLIMHSRADRMVEFDHAMRLYAAARLPKQFIEIDSDHISIFDKQANRQLLLDYLEGI